MVERYVAARGVADPRVLEAMCRVPRHLFVPPVVRARAYSESALPIGGGQTISQPYIVAAMTEALQLKPRDRVLEIGTGSGYQAAVLAEIVDEVYSIEILDSLGQRADSTLTALGYRNISVKIGDGYRGWPEKAPFDAVIVTAAPDHIPPALVNQLAVGGRMILPVGDEDQSLILLTNTAAGVERRTLFPVRFVPMTGEAEKPRPSDSTTPR